MPEVLFYDPGERATTRVLREVLQEVVPPDELNLCPDLETLSIGLRQPKSNIRCVVLAIPDKSVLRLLKVQGAFLSRVYTMLVLPTQDKAMLVDGYRLYPRIIAYLDCSAAVLREITAGMYRVVTEGERSTPDMANS